MPRTARTPKPIAAAINAAASAVPQTSYAAVVQWMGKHTRVVLAIEVLIDQAVLITAYAATSTLFGPVATFVIALLGAILYFGARLVGPLRTDKVVEAACTAFDAGRSRWDARKARAAATAY